jgi:hypothetical protein
MRIIVPQRAESYVPAGFLRKIAIARFNYNSIKSNSYINIRLARRLITIRHGEAQCTVGNHFGQAVDVIAFQFPIPVQPR